MTQRQIEDKAKRYADEMRLKKFPDAQPRTMEIFDAYDISTAFEAGVEYALNSLWHQTEEEKPQHWQHVLGVYRGNPFLFWMRYDYYKDESDDWWINGEGEELSPPDYWMAIPDSPIGNLTAERIL